MITSTLTMRRLFSACALAFCLVTATASADEAKTLFTSKWRLEVSGGAEADGSMTFQLTPENGAPTDVVVLVNHKDGENEVARKIRDAFKTAFTKDVYHVETDDGEDVLIKKRGKSADFNVKLASEPVKGIRVHVGKD